MARLNRSLCTLALSGILMFSPAVTPLVARADTTVSIIQSFSDVSQSYWAYPTILKMSLRGVVTGYNDGTFHPDSKVTELEAIVMAIRNMGLTSQLPTDANVSLPFDVPWGKNYVELAITKGLINPSENRFAASQPATREWVAELMVRMIGKQSDVSQLDPTAALSFTDSSSVSDWAKGYVEVAYNNGLIKGYQELNGYSFRPQQDVTRAEMVTLLSNGEGFLNIETSTTHLGTLLTINDSSLTIVNDSTGDQHTYTITKQTQFFDHTNAIAKSDIQPSSQLLVIGDSSGHALYVEVKGVSQNKVVSGTVQKVYPEVQSLVLQDSQGNIVTYKWDDNVKVSDNSGTLTDITQLENGDAVLATVAPSGKIIQLTRTIQSANASLDGTIYDIDTTNDLITIQTGDNQIAAYKYNSDTYVVHEGQRFPTVSDLRKGDHVALKVEQGVVTAITYEGNQSAAGNTGVVKAVIPDQQFIAIEGSDNQLYSYTVSNDAQITFSDSSAATLSDISNGDNVQYTLAADGKTITAITITNRTSSETNGLLGGTIESIDTTNNILTLQDAQGNLHAYQIGANAVYVVDGVSNPDITDLKKGMNVSLQLDQNNNVIYVSADNTLKGTVLAVDSDNNLLTVKLDSGDTKIYVVDPSAAIFVQNTTSTRENLTDMRVNDQISFKTDGAKITEIDVQRDYVYYVTNVDTGSNELTVQDTENTDGRILYLDGSVTFSIPGITYPTIGNVKAGDYVKISYLGDTLKTVTVVPSKIEQIMTVDQVNQNLVVQDLNQTTTTIPLSAVNFVKDSNLTDIPSTSLQAGDHILIAGSSDTGYYIQQLQRVDATFVSLDPLGDRIYTTDSSYYLPDILFNNNPNINTFLHSLVQNDKISIYFLNNQVCDIEKTN